jgi:hypothetical protein
MSTCAWVGLHALILCIRSGRTTLLHGRGSIQGMLMVAWSYLRLLLTKIYGFGILIFLVWQGLINDINVLQWSPIFTTFVEGNAPSVSYKIMGHTYTKVYYLDHDMYSEWPIFVKGWLIWQRWWFIKTLNQNKERYFMAYLGSTFHK